MEGLAVGELILVEVGFNHGSFPHGRGGKSRWA